MTDIRRAAEVETVCEVIEREKAMSEWFTIKDKNDVSLSDDGETVQIRFRANYMGNVYIEIPVEMLVKLLAREDVCLNCGRPLNGGACEPCFGLSAEDL